MAVPVNCPTCDAFYNLKSQYAGRLLECPTCSGVFRAPGRQVPAVFDRDIFQLREKHFAINTKYHVRDEDGSPLLYVELPALVLQRIMAFILIFIVISTVGGMFRTIAPGLDWGLVALIVAYFVGPRRHIHFYPDENKTAAILTVTQDYIVQIPTTRFTLRDLTATSSPPTKRTALPTSSAKGGGSTAPTAACCSSPRRIPSSSRSSAASPATSSTSPSSAPTSSSTPPTAKQSSANSTAK